MTGKDTIANSLDTLDDVFYIYDGDHRLIHWNRRLNEVFDLTDDELRGMRPTEFFVEEDRPRIERAVREVAERGETVVEARADTPSGITVFQLTGRALTDTAGEIIGLCGIGRDVTARTEREGELARENERLADFANLVAHDLRNPLSVAQGFLDIERAERDTPRLARVAGALDRIEHLVADVLTVAREGETVELTTPVAIDSIAYDAWETVDTRGATLVVRATGTVDADRERLHRLLENLFRNGVEHGSASGRTAFADAVERGNENADPEATGVTVTVSDTDTGFAVEDDGSGIPPAERERVFDPGHSGGSGTGLGLSIVRSLANAHGWTVRATAGDSGGARFEFDLGKREDAGVED